jgi:hypothetical protein
MASNADDDYEIQRRVYNITDFEKQYLKNNPNGKIKKKTKLSHKFLALLKFYKIFTIFNVIVEYDFKKLLIKDVISGITVGIMHIPQGTI